MKRGVGMAAGLLACCWAAAEPVALVDFAKEGHGWKGNPRTRDARQENGFAVELTGAEDPWLEGPAVAVPGFGEAQKIALALDAECEGDGAFRLFYAAPGAGFSEERAANLVRSAPTSRLYTGFIPAAADRMRFRWPLPPSSSRPAWRWPATFSGWRRERSAWRTTPNAGTRSSALWAG